MGGIMKKSSLGIMAASVLAVGVAHAGIGMRIEDERERRRKAFLDNECSATGQTCSMGPHGPNGEIQCQCCGKESVMANADFSEIERRVMTHNPALSAPYGADPASRLLDPEAYDSLKLYCEQDVALFGVNGQMDLYAQAAAEIMKPGDDEPMPDRFSVNPESPFYDKRWASIRIGVRFDGSDRPGDVEEYCVSEGWIRVQMFMKNGKVKRERGKIVCLKRHGKVEPYRK